MLAVFADEQHPRAVLRSYVAVPACEFDGRVNHHGAGSPFVSAEVRDEATTRSSNSGDRSRQKTQRMTCQSSP